MPLTLGLGKMQILEPVLKTHPVHLKAISALALQPEDQSVGSM